MTASIFPNALPAGAYIPPGMTTAAPIPPPPPPVVRPATVSQAVQLCSGYGQYHTANRAAEYPKPYTTLSMANISELMDNPPSVDKAAAQWAIFTDYTGENARDAAHLRATSAKYYALWADIDEAAGVAAQEILSIASVAAGGAKTHVYASRSATEQNQKAHILAPLAEPVDAVTFEIMQKVFNNRLEAAGLVPDDKTEICNQLCYLPNRGAFYWSGEQGTQALNPKSMAKEVEAIRAAIIAEDEARAVRMAANAARYAELIAKQGATPIQAASEAYGDPRDLLIHYGGIARGDRVISPNSSSGSAGVTFNDGKWYSSHGSDVAAGMGQQSNNGRSCWGDSFDLVCFFEYGNDRTAAVRAMAERFQPTANKQRQINHRREQDEAAALKAFSQAGVSVEPVASVEPVVAIRNGWDLAEDAQPARYLVDGLLEEDAHGILGGASMTYKTFKALRLAYSICSGKPFAGREVYKTGAVVYVCGEGQGAVSRRFRALLLKHGRPKHAIHLITSGVAFNDTPSMAKLLETIKPLKPVLVIFDTFASLSGGIEENSNSEVGAALNAVRDMCRVAGASSLIVHHFGKNAEQGFRGASAFTNNVDFAFMAHRRGADDSKQSGLTCHKMKDGEHFREIAFKAEVVPLGIYDQKQKESTSLVAEHDPSGGRFDEAQGAQGATQADIMLRELRRLQSEASITNTKEDPTWISWSAWSGALKDHNLSNVFAVRKRLIELGSIVESKNKYRAV